MSGGLVVCIKKDIKEVLRTGKLILIAGLLFGIGFMVLVFTVIFSNIPKELWSLLEGFDIEALEKMMEQFYPKIVSESLELFSYNVGAFFTLILVIMMQGQLPGERDAGTWILPRQHGITPMDLIESKCIVYGGISGVSVTMGYLVYYLLAMTFMERNMTFVNALVCALVHGFNILFIVTYMLFLSMLLKKPIAGAISVVAVVLLMPDIGRFFPFGIYFPTNLLTFVYDSSSNYRELPVPFVLNVFILLVMWIMLRHKYMEKRD